MHVLVTGAAGFIGPFLIRKLVNLGHTVHGADRTPMDDLPLDETTRGDLADSSVARAAMTDAECVCHLAAARADWGLSEGEYYHDNLDATRTLIEAGRKEGVTDWVFYS
ncbi:MAG: NAD-dependent epimerase/dehydratase family protein, partial [Salinibacter sp.]